MHGHERQLTALRDRDLLLRPLRIEDAGRLEHHDHALVAELLLQALLKVHGRRNTEVIEKNVEAGVRHGVEELYRERGALLLPVADEEARLLHRESRRGEDR